MTKLEEQTEAIILLTLLGYTPDPTNLSYATGDYYDSPRDSGFTWIKLYNLDHPDIKGRKGIGAYKKRDTNRDELLNVEHLKQILEVNINDKNN
ncbi:MAG: hypothetical protein HRU18_02605 [Pseudoalteromonas sp.]|uniref:hypothetical protein n=1 Tax=Pseudoalteromonas sp. TaxID=53249 RepID=UPI001DDAD6F7|nr:hypothetical protein [Pseudoalteromonas sp.]NRA77074.1 hypothetical protein [Pseudoalteromonas sp.]